MNFFVDDDADISEMKISCNELSEFIGVSMSVHFAHAPEKMNKIFFVFDDERMNGLGDFVSDWQNEK